MSEGIKLVPTQDLIAELKSRFDVCIFMSKAASVYSKDDVVYRRMWKGEYTECVGLCGNLAWHINKEQNENGTSLPPGE